MAPTRRKVVTNLSLQLFPERYSVELPRGGMTMSDRLLVASCIGLGGLTVALMILIVLLRFLANKLLDVIPVVDLRRAEFRARLLYLRQIGPYDIDPMRNRDTSTSR